MWCSYGGLSFAKSYCTLSLVHKFRVFCAVLFCALLWCTGSDVTLSLSLSLSLRAGMPTSVRAVENDIKANACEDITLRVELLDEFKSLDTRSQARFTARLLQVKIYGCVVWYCVSLCCYACDCI